MTDKVNGTSFAGQFLTGGLNFYTVRTTLDIRPSASKDLQDPAQKRLDKLVEAISTRAQPVILNAVKTSVETSPVDLPGATGSVTVYSMSFAIEHNMAWEVQGSSNPTLSETLDGVEGFVYDIAITDDNNVIVALVESL